MPNFRIGTQIDTELRDFDTAKVKLAVPRNSKDNHTVRYLEGNKSGYFFNQRDTLTLIDLCWASQFDNGEYDSLNQRKIYLNVAKFRSEIASKNIDIDTKDGRFIPDDYADPWTAFFLQKDYKEWAKDSDLADLINKCVDDFPKYGTIVGKEIRNEKGNKDVTLVPLQNLKNEQTAKSLATATYVIEEHPDMEAWEIQGMTAWKTDGLPLKYGEKLTVYERHGHVPVKWLEVQHGSQIQKGDSRVSVDAVVYAARIPKQVANAPDGWWVFYANEEKKRPYREKHYNRQHGRWLGVGVIEDLFANQTAKNIIANLFRRSLHWSSKHVFGSTSTAAIGKNLVKDVVDGEVLELGAQGSLTHIDMGNRSISEFLAFDKLFDSNSDQKAFTYEVTSGASLPGSTPATIGVILSKATASYYEKKREALGLFLKEIVVDFKVPQFLKDMGNEEKVLAMFSGEPGFQALKEAAMDYVRSEASRIALLSGEEVDVDTLLAATKPFEAVRMLFINRPENYYKEAKFKFDFSFTGEEFDLAAKLESAKTIYQLLAQKGDPRAEQVLERIGALGGFDMSTLNVPKAPPVQAMPGNQQNAPLPAPQATV